MAVLAGAGLNANDSGISGSTSGVGRDFFDTVNTVVSNGTIETLDVEVITGTLDLKIKTWRINGSNYDFLGESALPTAAVGTNIGLALTTPLSVLIGDIVSIHVPATAATSHSVSVANAAPDAVKWSGGSSDFSSTQTIASISSTLAFSMNFSANGTVSAATITSDAVKQGTQRNLSTSAFTVTGSGTYTGTPTTIERQVRYADGAQEVVLAWATYDASPAGGTFTGTIDLTANVRPFGIDYRFSNDTGVTDTSNDFYGGDYILTIGESTALDMFTDGTATPSAGVFLAHAVTAAISTTTTGQGQIDNANAIVADTGVAAFMLNTGVGSLRVISQNGSPYLYDPTTPTASYNSALAAYNAAGDIAFVNFIIGANDAFNQLSTTTQYTDGITDFLAKFRLDTGRADLEFYASLTGRNTTAPPSDQVFSDFFFAQKSAYDSDANVFTTQIYDLPLTDNVHLTPAGYGSLGVRLANAAISNIYGGSADWQAPIVASIEAVTTTSTRFNLTQGQGTDFTPTTGITGIDLTEAGDGYGVTGITSARETATSILVTHDAATVTAGRAYFGAAPVITGIVLDNSTLNLPLAPVTMNASVLASTLNITTTGTPDGTYKTIITNPADDSLVFAGDLVYTSGAATTGVLALPVGTALTGYVIDNEVAHLNGAVIDGVTV